MRPPLRPTDGPHAPAQHRPPGAVSSTDAAAAGPGLPTPAAADARRSLVSSRGRLLPYGRIAPGEDPRLVDPDGAAVWPVRTDAEANAIRTLAGVFAAEAMEVDAVRGSCEAGSGRVIALGAEVAAEARLYAHLSQRSHAVAGSLGDLLATGPPAVVVARTSDVTPSLLEALCRIGEAGVMPGLVFSAERDGLRRQVLLRTAARELDGPLEDVRTDVIPYLQGLGDIRAGGARIVGGDTAPSVIEAALQGGAGVLSLTTKSDGIDASLGRERLLCAMDRPPPWADPARDPRCRSTGMCHRLEIATGEALASGRLLSPDEIRARIFVFNVCWGLAPPAHILDPAWGLGYRLLENPSIGALVTSWEITLTSPEHAMILSESITSGLSLGEAVARFNGLPHCRATHQRMVLIGDPDVRIRAPAAELLVEGGTAADPATSPAIDDTLAELSLLRACAHRAATDGWGFKGVREIATAAVDAISRYELAAWRGQAANGTEGLAQAMREAVLGLVLRRARLFEDWLAFTHALAPDTVLSPCFACGERSTATIARFRIPGVADRKLMNCPHCSAISDLPVGYGLTLAVVSDRLHLGGTPPRTNWTAGVCLTSAWPGENLTLDWPATADGSPEPEMTLPPPWPTGPLRLSVVVVNGTRLAFFTKMMRQP